MINRKSQKKAEYDRNRQFYDHYFSMIDLSEFGNDKVMDRIKQLDSSKDFFKVNFILANIPEKYYDFEYEDIKSQLEQEKKNHESLDILETYMSSLEKALQKGVGLYIYGPHGVAKTTLSTIILKRAMKQYLTTFFCKSLEIIDFARSGWKSDDRKRFWNYVPNNVQFFVIDDVARLAKVAESEQTYIDEIFTKRDGANLPTIITSNTSLKESKESFGSALFSNFLERLIEVPIIGDDYRLSIGKKLIDQLK